MFWGEAKEKQKPQANVPESLVPRVLLNGAADDQSSFAASREILNSSLEAIPMIGPCKNVVEHSHSF